MSPEERDLILAHVPELAPMLTFIDWSVNGKVALKAGPCPLLDEQNLCRVHPVKPYNCRRWGCFRPDPKTEPLEPDHGFLGSKATRERWEQSREVRRALVLMQRKAQKWALKHGWTGKENE